MKEEKIISSYSLQIIKLLIVIENELSKGFLCKDRILYLEGLLKEINIRYSASNNLDLYKISQKLNNILIDGLKKCIVKNASSNKNMQKLSQQLRKVRKELEGIDFSVNDRRHLLTSAKRCFNRKAMHKMRALLEPMFNVLEIYKQSLLLVDHLSDKNLRCKTCIVKHTLFIEALCEEAVGLDCKGVYYKDLVELLNKIKFVRITYFKDGRSSYAKITQKVKEVIEDCEKMLNSLSKSQKLKIYS